jgi:hypothetical protein
MWHAMRHALMPVVATGLLALTDGCAERSPAGASASSGARHAPADGAPLAGGELAGYAAGRREEIETMRAALASGGAVGDARLDSVGARAAGLEVDAYRRVVARVEWALRSPGASAAGGELARRRGALDSLRVERLVLAIRLGR